MNKNRRSFIKNTAAISLGSALLPSIPLMADDTATIGIIGLDTSHSVAFTRFINSGEFPQEGKPFKVKLACRCGSKTIPSSYERIPEYEKGVKELGVEVLNSIEEVVEKSDAILLETNDGKLHLEQAKIVLKSGKPVFIDKPVAAQIKEVYEIYELAEKYKSPMFSSSSLRYLNNIEEIRNEGLIGDVIGADAYSPIDFEPSHSDFYWYGIHGMEILFAVMGTGCEYVQTEEKGDFIFVKAVWKDGRVGNFRGDLKKRQQYGGMAYGTKSVQPLGPFSGYGNMMPALLKFFKTGIAPVDHKETLELYTCMEAAAISRRSKGKAISLDKIRP